MAGRPEEATLAAIRTEQVMSLLRQHRIHHLPVLRGEELVGIITPADVIRYMVEEVLAKPPEIS